MTVSFPAMFVLVTVAFGLTIAANILVSQTYGAKDWPKLRRVVQNATLLVIVAGIVCLAVGLAFLDPILRAIRTPPSVMPMAVSYMRIFLCMIPATFGVFLMASMLRGTGDSATPLYFQGGSLVLTAILDPLLMFGWLGFPKLGLNGTAVATVIANYGAAIAILVYLHRKRHVIAPDWRGLRADWETSWLMLKIGVPSMAQNALLSWGLMVITGFVNTFGETATAAFGGAMRIDNFAFLPALTTGMAVATLAGQNIGARQLERVKEECKWGVVLGGGTTMLAGLIMAAAPGFWMSLVSSDPRVIALGITYLRIVPLSYVILAVMFVGNGVINGAGHTFFTTIITFIALWLVRVPLAWRLAIGYHRLDGVWYAMVAGFFAGALVSLGYYLSGRWKQPVSRGFLASAEPEVAADSDQELSLGTMRVLEDATE